MPVIEQGIPKTQPMTIRGLDGRVYKTPQMELNARDAVAKDVFSRTPRNWLNMLLRAPD